MRVVLISTDRQMCDAESSVAQRHARFGEVFERVDIVVLSGKGCASQQLADNVYLHPTNSAGKIRRLFNAITIGKTLVSTDDGLQTTDAVVSAQDPFEVGFVAWRIARHAGVPLQLQLHTDPFSDGFKTGFWQRCRILLMHFLLPKADCVRVVRHALRERLAAEGLADAGQVSVVPVATRLPDVADATAGRAALEQLMPAKDAYIVCMGRLAPEKRYADAIAVLAAVRERGMRAGLVYIGEGAERQQLEQAAADQGVAAYVAFAGWRQARSAMLAGADVFLHTSQFEGYGLALLEAAAAGTPVVTTDVGIAREAFADGEGAHICPVGDTTCLADRIMRLLRDPQHARQMAVAGEQNARAIAWGEAEYLAGVQRSLEQCTSAR